MRISDWSSDVCSSDLDPDRRDEVGAERFAACERLTPEVEPLGKFVGETWDAGLDGVEDVPGFPEIRIGSACHLRYHGWHRPRSGKPRHIVAAIAFGIGEDRKRGVEGKSVSVRVDLGGPPII